MGVSGEGVGVVVGSKATFVFVVFPKKKYTVTLSITVIVISIN